MSTRTIAAAASLALAALTLGAPPARAETPAELDALARASEQPGTGIALARKQIDAGDLLDALATLERVILNHPHNQTARLLHASVMCRIDERRGALIELDTLRGRDIPGPEWDEATTPCSSRRES